MNKKYRIAFFGTPEVAVPTLNLLSNHSSVEVAAVITQPDKPSGRGHKLNPSPVKEVASTLNIPVLQPVSIKKEKETFIEQLNKIGHLDGAVVVSFGQILPEWLLDHLNNKCINVHFSLLPRWRGAAPMQRAIMSGDTETGVALMQMEKGLDTGGIYLLKKVPITEYDTSGDLFEKLSILGAELIRDGIIDILDDKIKPTPQSVEGVTHAQKIDKKEAKIIWNKKARELLFHINGLSPFPGAYTFFEGKRLKILRVGVIKDLSGPPGSVIKVDSSSLVIACQEDALSLKEVQLEGKKSMKIEEFLKGNKVISTSVFQ